MDVREKLMDLIQESGACFDCFPVSGYEKNQIEKIASHLIDYGVTVQERGYWVSLNDCANAGVYCSVCHKKVYKEDCAWCNRKNKLRSDYCPHCGAKMMPQPPKGE